VRKDGEGSVVRETAVAEDARVEVEFEELDSAERIGEEERGRGGKEANRKKPGRIVICFASIPQATTIASSEGVGW
jgi:hypothetical protein